MKSKFRAAATAALLAVALPAFAADLPSSKRTGLGLYLSSEEAAQFLAATPEAVMIDVRTPEEIDESGLAEEVDALIPLAVEQNGKGLAFNPDFYPGIVRLATSRQLAADDPIVIICRSGNRSAQAADALSGLGFTRVYTVTDGYLGDRSKSGARDVNGWRNAGLPWRKQAAASCAPARDGGAC